MKFKCIIKSLIIIGFLYNYSFSSTTNNVDMQNNQSKVDNNSLLKKTGASAMLSLLAKQIVTKFTTSPKEIATKREENKNIYNNMKLYEEKLNSIKEFQKFVNNHGVQYVEIDMDNKKVTIDFGHTVSDKHSEEDHKNESSALYNFNNLEEEYSKLRKDIFKDMASYSDSYHLLDFGKIRVINNSGFGNQITNIEHSEEQLKKNLEIIKIATAIEKHISKFIVHKNVVDKETIELNKLIKSNYSNLKNKIKDIYKTMFRDAHIKLRVDQQRKYKDPGNGKEFQFSQTVFIVNPSVIITPNTWRFNIDDWDDEDTIPKFLETLLLMQCNYIFQRKYLKEDITKDNIHYGDILKAPLKSENNQYINIDYNDELQNDVINVANKINYIYDNHGNGKKLATITDIARARKDPQKNNEIIRETYRNLQHNCHIDILFERMNKILNDTIRGIYLINSIINNNIKDEIVKEIKDKLLNTVWVNKVLYDKSSNKTESKFILKKNNNDYVFEYKPEDRI